MDQILMKILPKMYFQSRKTPLNFGSHADWDMDVGMSQRDFCRCSIGVFCVIMPWERSPISKCSCPVVV